MASVEKRGKYWSVRYLAHDAYGNIVGQKRKSGFATKADAMAAARDLERATDAGVDVHGDMQTCGQLIEQWRQQCVGLSPITAANYDRWVDQLRPLPIWSATVRSLPDTAAVDTITAFVDGGLSVNTALSYVKPLRSALSWACSRGVIQRNPIAGVRLQRIQRHNQTILSEAHIAALVAYIRERCPEYLIPFYLGVYGGLRRGEACGLTWDNVDLDRGTLRICKTRTGQSGKSYEKSTKTDGSTRTVTMPRFALDYMRLYRPQSGLGYVCISSRGKPYDPNTLRSKIAELAREYNTRHPEAQIPVPSYHDLRHTHAALLIALGIQPKIISERLGHKSIDITMDLYGYLMPGLQETVADALNARWA